MGMRAHPLLYALLCDAVYPCFIYGILMGSASNGFAGRGAKLDLAHCMTRLCLLLLHFHTHGECMFEVCINVMIQNQPAPVQSPPPSQNGRGGRGGGRQFQKFTYGGIGNDDSQLSSYVNQNTTYSRGRGEHHGYRGRGNSSPYQQRTYAQRDNDNSGDNTSVASTTERTVSNRKDWMLPAEKV